MDSFVFFSVPSSPESASQSISIVIVNASAAPRKSIHLGYDQKLPFSLHCLRQNELAKIWLQQTQAHCVRLFKCGKMSRFVRSVWIWEKLTDIKNLMARQVRSWLEMTTNISQKKKQIYRFYKAQMDEKFTPTVWNFRGKKLCQSGYLAFHCLTVPSQKELTGNNVVQSGVCPRELCLHLAWLLWCTSPQERVG